jgi:hypothetical protein
VKPVVRQRLRDFCIRGRWIAAIIAKLPELLRRA